MEVKHFERVHIIKAFRRGTPIHKIEADMKEFGITPKQIKPVIAEYIKSNVIPLPEFEDEMIRKIPKSDVCPTKLWLRNKKTLTLEMVEDGNYDENHVIGNVRK